MMEKLLRWIDAHLIALLLALFVLRSGFLLVENIGLMGDESYYWDWSRHPAWCYYSKPPMVAWLIGVFTWLLGDYTASLRLPAVIAGTVFLWFFHATAKAFYGRRAAAFALLMILATPANVLANLLMTIDAPLYCFWMMTIFFLQRALFDFEPWAWLWAGCATAAALLSKQVAIALPLMLLAFILLDHQRWRRLRCGFALYLAPVLLAGLPILIWNAGHHWVMFQHSKDHFTAQISASLVNSLDNVGELLLYQQLLITPLIFVPVTILSVQSVRRLRNLVAPQQFLVLMGPLLLLGVLLLSLEQKVQGNWPMPFYFTGLILLAGAWQAGRWRKWLQYGVSLGYLMVALTYLLPNALNALHLQDSRYDLLKRFNHWPGLAIRIEAERRLGVPEPDSFVVALGHRNLASQLAFYLPDHPAVFRYEASGAVKSQYELWPGPEAFTGKNALVVSDSQDVPDQISRAFRTFTFIKAIANPMHSNQPFYLFSGQDLIAWPTAANKETK
ncbi:MAG: glycosyltransferase family 39 protein [Methylococcales bacterium]|nr:glycosyltransferase family 39 protein [Methylococcales bacterium]